MEPRIQYAKTSDGVRVAYAPSDSSRKEPRMKFGIFAPLVNPFATPDYIRALGTAAEERGFDSIWAAEHVLLFDSNQARSSNTEAKKRGFTM